MAEEVAAKLDILAAKVDTLSLEKKWEPMDYPPDRIEHVRRHRMEYPGLPGHGAYMPGRGGSRVCLELNILNDAWLGKAFSL